MSTAVLGGVIVEFLGKAGPLLAEVDKAAQSIDKVGQRSTAAGATMTAALTAPLVAVSAFAVKMASNWESAFAGVRKTVNGDLTAIEAGIRSMAKSMPVASEELAGIAQNAGQLGIAKQDILAFTDTIARLGVSTNLSSEEAAMSLAKFMNITSTGTETIGQLGSAIVYLGNNFATTESDVVAMSMRIAKAGETAGLSRTEILGLATALSSVGIEAEAGGSAMSRILIDMQVAARKGGADLAEYARIAGTTSDAFAKMAQQKPAEAIEKLVQGLKGIKDSGGDVFGALQRIGIEEVRTRDAALGLANAADMVGKAMRGAGEAAQQNTALLKESETRFQTFESRVKIAWGTVKDLAVTIGTAMLPALNMILDAFTRAVPVIEMFARQFAGLSPTTMLVVMAFGALVASIGPALLLFGQMAAGVASLTALLAPMAPTLVAIGGAATGASSGIVAFGTATKVAATAAAALAGALVILAGISLAAWAASIASDIDQANAALQKADALMAKNDAYAAKMKAARAGTLSRTDADASFFYGWVQTQQNQVLGSPDTAKGGGANKYHGIMSDEDRKAIEAKLAEEDRWFREAAEYTEKMKDLAEKIRVGQADVYAKAAEVFSKRFGADGLGGLDWKEIVATAKRNKMDEDSAMPGFGAENTTTEMSAKDQVALAMAGLDKGAAKAKELSAALKAAGANLTPEQYERVAQSLGISASSSKDTAGGIASMLQAAAALKDIVGGKAGSILGGGASMFGGLSTLLNSSGGGFGKLFEGGASSVMKSMASTVIPAIGALAGPVIGAIGSWFENRKLDKIGKEAGASLGMSVSRETAKAIQGTMKELKVDAGTAGLLNLDKLMGEKGLDGQTKDAREFTSQISALMKGIASGAVPAKQGVEALGKAFSAVAEAAKAAGTVGDKALTSILTAARSQGGAAYTEEMKAFTADKLSAAQAGVEKFVTAISKLFGNGLGADLGAQSATIFMATFSAVAAEKGRVEAVRSMKETGDKLIEALTSSLSGPELDAALASLGEFARFSGYLDNEKLAAGLDAIDGLKAGLIGLADAGYLDIQTFEAMQGATGALFDSLTNNGMEVGDALAAVAPAIQAAISASEQFGVPLTEDLQKLKDLAEQNGITFKTDPMERMANALEAIAIHIGAMAAGADKAGAAFDRNFNREYNTRVNVTTVGNEDGGVSGGGSVPVDFTAASGFYSASMPRGRHAEGMTYIGVHPGEEVSVVPKSQNAAGGGPSGGASGGGPAGGAPQTLILQVGQEVFGKLITNLMRNGFVQVPDHAVTSNL